MKIYLMLVMAFAVMGVFFVKELPADEPVAQQVEPSPPASQPDTQPAPSIDAADYLGKSVTKAWIKSTFAVYGRNLYRRSDTLAVINILDANIGEDGKPCTKPIFVHRRSDIGQMANEWIEAVNMEGMVCQFRNVKVQAKTKKNDGYVVSSDQGEFVFLTGEEHVAGESLKNILFYGLKRATVIQGQGQSVGVGGQKYIDLDTKGSPPMFVETKPVSLDDFIKFINGGNRLIMSCKQITRDDVKTLPITDYKMIIKDSNPQYFRFIYLAAPK